MKTLRPEIGFSDGSAQGRKTRVFKLTVRQHRSLGVKFGPTLEKLDELPTRSSEDLMNQAPALFSGDSDFNFNAGWSGGQVIIAQDLPLPQMILSIVTRLNINEP